VLRNARIHTHTHTRSVSCKINAYKISRGLVAVILINCSAISAVSQCAATHAVHISRASRFKLNKCNSSRRDTGGSSNLRVHGTRNRFVEFKVHLAAKGKLCLARGRAAKVVLCVMPVSNRRRKYLRSESFCLISNMRWTNREKNIWVSYFKQLKYQGNNKINLFLHLADNVHCWKIC